MNACYPWNENPMLCCSEFGGLFHPILHEVLGDIYSCLSYNLVTEEIWETYFKEEKKESKNLEEQRKKAMDGEVMTNQTLPEHILGAY